MHRRGRREGDAEILVALPEADFWRTDNGGCRRRCTRWWTDACGCRCRCTVRPPARGRGPRGAHVRDIDGSRAPRVSSRTDLQRRDLPKAPDHRVLTELAPCFRMQMSSSRVPSRRVVGGLLPLPPSLRRLAGLGQNCKQRCDLEAYKNGDVDLPCDAPPEGATTEACVRAIAGSFSKQCVDMRTAKYSADKKLAPYFRPDDYG